MTGKKRLVQGVYRPINPKKYLKGNSQIIYRSSWELQVMHKFDIDPNILRWSSEEVIISYISPLDNKIHRYYPDFYCEYWAGEYETDENGKTLLTEDNRKIKKIRKAIVEIKPKTECNPPKQTQRITEVYRKKVATYVVNQAKWKAADEYAKKYKMEFLIWTEDFLKNI